MHHQLRQQIRGRQDIVQRHAHRLDALADERGQIAVERKVERRTGHFILQEEGYGFRTDEAAGGGEVSLSNKVYI